MLAKQQRAVLLNRIAQGFCGLQDGIDWFTALDVDERRTTLRELAGMVLQAHPSPEHVVTAITRSGLRPGHTPVVLISRDPVERQAYVVANRMSPNGSESFRLLLELLASRTRTGATGGAGARAPTGGTTLPTSLLTRAPRLVRLQGIDRVRADSRLLRHTSKRVRFLPFLESPQGPLRLVHVQIGSRSGVLAVQGVVGERFGGPVATGWPR